MVIKDRFSKTASFSQGDKQTLHKNLGFVAAEQYKLMRANLQFMLPDVEKCRIVGVTSSIRGEGKSTTSINLAHSLAEDGKKVLLIDADMRLPSIAKKMEIQQTPGLSNLLAESVMDDIPVLKTEFSENWYILTSGDIPPNPSELLGSKKMAKLLEILSKDYDFIVLDLPPINIVSDAMAVSSYIHGLVVVVREGYSEKKELNNCIRQIELSDIKLLGFVMNDVNNGEGSYRRYNYNKYYRHYYRTNAED